MKKKKCFEVRKTLKHPQEDLKKKIKGESKIKKTDVRVRSCHHEGTDPPP